MEYTRIEKHE